MTQARGSLAARFVIGAVLLGAATWVLLTSPVFHIREVRVEGERAVAADDLIGLAEVREGENLVTLDTDRVVARLEGHAWIAEAHVDRDLPSTLLIRVVERDPAAWVVDPSGPVIVAGDGVILERVERKPGNLPHIGSSPDVLVPGASISGYAEQLRVVEAMDPRLLREIESTDLDDGDLTLQLRQGGVVLYGTPGNVGAKAQALDDILRWAEQEGISPATVDVRVPSAPALSPTGGGRIPTPIPTP